MLLRFIEDEIFQKHSILDVKFGGEKSSSGSHEDIFHTLVIPVEKWKNCLSELKTLVNELEEN